MDQRPEAKEGQRRATGAGAPAKGEGAVVMIDWPRVVVELGRRGQGQCFGDVREGCGKGAYPWLCKVPCG